MAWSLGNCNGSGAAPAAPLSLTRLVHQPGKRAGVAPPLARNSHQILAVRCRREMAAADSRGRPAASLRQTGLEPVASMADSALRQRLLEFLHAHICDQGAFDEQPLTPRTAAPATLPKNLREAPHGVR